MLARQCSRAPRSRMDPDVRSGGDQQCYPCYPAGCGQRRRSHAQPSVTPASRSNLATALSGARHMCRDAGHVPLVAGGDAECMGIFDAHVKRFDSAPGVKIPHMGWSRISNLESKLFNDIQPGSYMYFVHSYYAPLCPDTIATARHPALFSAALKYENFYGTRFHPEKKRRGGAATYP